LITDVIRECQAPLQVPYLLEVLKTKHGVQLSATYLRKYLKRELGMSYRKVGVVGKHYDDHKNLLKRQLAAASSGPRTSGPAAGCGKGSGCLCRTR